MTQSMATETNDKLVKQIEFYLSDGNLRRDQFFKDLLRRNQLISLEVFLNCKKVKQLTKNLDDIRAAVESSTKLQLNEEKNSVQRIEQVDVDQLEKADPLPSVFLGNLAVSANIESIEKMCSESGQVVFVELRRLEDVTKFALVEFESEEAVEKAISQFAALDWEQYVSGNTDKKVAAMDGKVFRENLEASCKDLGIVAGTSLRVTWKHIVKEKVTEADLRTCIGDTPIESMMMRDDSSDCVITFKSVEDCGAVQQKFMTRKLMVCKKVVKAFQVPVIDMVRLKVAERSNKRKLEDAEVDSETAEKKSKNEE